MHLRLIYLQHSLPCTHVVVVAVGFAIATAVAATVVVAVVAVAAVALTVVHCNDIIIYIICLFYNLFLFFTMLQFGLAACSFDATS